MHTLKEWNTSHPVCGIVLGKEYAVKHPLGTATVHAVDATRGTMTGYIVKGRIGDAFEGDVVTLRKGLIVKEKE